MGNPDPTVRNNGVGSKAESNLSRRNVLKGLGAGAAAIGAFGMAHSVFIDDLPRDAMVSTRIGDAMKSTRIQVHFDSLTEEPTRLVSLTTAESLNLVPVSSFRFELDRLQDGQLLTAELAAQEPSTVIDAMDCKITDVEQRTDSDGMTCRTIRFENKQAVITVKYALGKDAHYLLKDVRFEPLFKEPYVLRRVDTQRFSLSEDPGKHVQFHHGLCVTHFLRKNQTSFFFGIQVPLEVEIENVREPIDLGHPVNLRFKASEAYNCESMFWGCATLSGRYAPKTKNYHKVRMSTIPPDLGESRAMIDMVVDLTEASPRALTVLYNGWVSGHNRKGYPMPQPREGMDQEALIEEALADEKRRLNLFIEQGGESFFEFATPWLSSVFDLAKEATVNRAEPTINPVVDHMMHWLKENNMKAQLWTSLKSPNCWEGVRLFCPDHKAWWGKGSGPSFNCPVNNDYLEWHIRLAVDYAKKYPGIISGHSQDENHPMPETRIYCTSEEHDHLPGDATYGWYRATYKLQTAMRRQLGPEGFLCGYRPQQDAGIWSCMLLDSVFTCSERSAEGGDGIRKLARVRHYYQFIPSYMDQALIGIMPNGTMDRNHVVNHGDSPEYMMLSALAVSNTHLHYGAGATSEIRKRVRRWVDWARDNGDIMRAQSIFLPEWPGSGSCDSYLRLANGRGYLFVFNSHSQPAKAVVPLTEEYGLVKGRSYKLQQVFPESDRQVIGGQKDVFKIDDVQAKTALLFEILPEN